MMLLIRWKKLMTRMGMKENKETFDALIRSYSEAHRRYHTLAHLESVLTTLDKYESLAEHKGELELGLWFHDAVYQPYSTTNEFNSAEWARQFLEQSQVSSRSTDLVVRLINATSHTKKPDVSDERLILDIDLSVLGQSEDVYAEYSDGVRHEFRRVPYYLYRKKRKSLLLKFLSRARIYSTEGFFLALEDKARSNIRREVRTL